MVAIKRGDIILCDFNPVIGTEQSGIRPAVIIQIDRANTASPHTIVAPLTSRIRKSLLQSHVFVPIGVANLTQDSVILCEQIRVIDKSRIIRVIGYLDREYIIQLNVSLCTILGLSDDEVAQIIVEEE
ncbi:type II toxin-antitoxin system PemK/MazF family toxin [Chamaesiphon sp. GL140_3_metabinner_50]|uniref:type II toxin-antitoxin system PemK/MazF family toxin n=1 Tax=Chamaesiphon sp. GL140_3_metabinner_50 TaxID=2970812 RepID=UPI0025E13D92|nr:type II toxin-antitoxin system PemK/MazF family toxin [Chamaesiphon sp. GL140_3_metabinner_50]